MDLLVCTYQTVLIKASPCVLPYADKALGEFFCYLRLEKLHENVIDLHALAYGLDCMDDDAPPPLMMLHPNDQDEDDDIQPVPDPLPPYIYIYIYISRKDCIQGGVDYLAHVHEPLYSGIMSPPQRLSVMIKNHQPTLGILVMLPLGPDSPHSSRSQCSRLEYNFPPGIRPDELGVYQTHSAVCNKKVDTRAVLKFMEPSDGRFHLYEMAVDAYSKVLKDSDADTETVIERYFQCLQWEEEQKTLDDLYGFVEGVDCFAQMEDEYFSEIIYTGYISIRVPLGLRFVFQRVDGRKVIEITVESWLLEKVASLKEKIGKMIQMQAKELKLRRKAGGVLKEDKSLAHNNVEAGEILTPTDLAHFKVELGRCKS
ncbi:unnamed protein product [Brassica oleracea var. botrytis]|nr:unnamed protein product [Brassica oleracea]